MFRLAKTLLSKSTLSTLYHNRCMFSNLNFNYINEIDTGIANDIQPTLYR
jgi:hypothetical protein